MVDEALSSSRCADTLEDRADHLDGAVHLVHVDVHGVTDGDRRSRFGRTTIDPDVSALARCGGLRAGRADSNGPQPLIHPCRVHPTSVAGPAQLLLPAGAELSLRAVQPAVVR